MAITPGLMTAEELARLPDDGQRYELVRGELRTMSPPGFEHGGVTLRCGSSLLLHADAHQLGTVVTDAGFRLATDPDIVRSPDVAFVTREHTDPAGRVRGFWVGAPDLAVEVISPNDLYSEVDEKVADYLEYGTRLVLVINPRRSTVAAHRPGQPVLIYAGNDVLDAEDILPGWKLSLPDLFRRP